MQLKQSPTSSFAQVSAMGRVCEVRHHATLQSEGGSHSLARSCSQAITDAVLAPPPEAPPPPSTPRIIADKYRLHGLLGRGGMGSVWRADHISLNSPVAVKLLEPWIAADALGLARFLREARAAACLRSPHVVQIFDHGVHQGIPYIVMELLEGESLATRLEREQRLSFRETLRVVTHISRALTRAHAAGIVHRDLKPENVFLVNDEDEPLAKLLDFGIAKAAPNAFEVRVEQTTSPGLLVGTPYYASPEQAQGAKVLDHRSDVWALGVIAFECLVGERPFLGEALGEVLLGICVEPLPVPSQRGTVPPGFDAWFARACARDLDQRFESAKLAASELARLCSSVSVPEVRFRPSRVPEFAPSTLGATVNEVDLHARRPLAVAGTLGAFALGTALVASALWFRLRPLQSKVTVEPSSYAAPADMKGLSSSQMPAPPKPPTSLPTAQPGPTVTVVSGSTFAAPPKSSTPASELTRPRQTPLTPRPRLEPIRPTWAAPKASTPSRASAPIPDSPARLSVDLGI